MESACSLALMGMSLAALLAGSLPVLRANVLHYGKLNAKSNTSEAESPIKKTSTPPKRPHLQSWLERVATARVPKRYFIHFYYYGFLLQASLLVGALQHLRAVSCSKRDLWILTLPPQLFLVHLARRSLECRAFDRGSRATMHWLHYIVGLSFYTLMAFVHVIPAMRIKSGLLIITNRTSPAIAGIGFGTALFLAMNALQNSAHRDLADLRSKDGDGHPRTVQGQSQDTSQKYLPPPRKWPWQAMVAPHYTFEVGIYIALCLIQSALASIYIQNFPYASMSALLWTSLNLAITARETERWGGEYFGTKWPRNRCIILPGIY